MKIHLPSRRTLFGVVAVLALSVGTGVASADGLPQPKGRVVLTLSGKIGEGNKGKDAVFAVAMLEALPQHSFTTRTPWYDRPVKFTGPLLSDLLALTKVHGTTISASAINDYTIRIPLVDAKTHGIIVARLLDDRPIAVSDKGPLFVVYPFDSKTELRTSTYYERSI